MNKFTLITKPGCNYCTLAKDLLEAKNINFVEIIIGEDMLREKFIERYPSRKTVPLILDGERVIGGYEELKKYVEG